ncbi:MAG: glycogen/starch/alpha-glucan phosphorylase [Clostridia bacterium]|nr:glycogen/starch/alpha-glucan phosphorylase [Clostridia bacterium]
MPKTYTMNSMKQAIAGKLQRHFSRELGEASLEQVYEACALVIRDTLTEHMIETQNQVEKNGERQVHYLCMEFLIGRSLRNNAYNLDMLAAMRGALEEMGIDMADLFEQEADPGLGNGGLGRLAACYMDAMATTGVRAMGYSIRYEHGIFKQKIVDGQQVELPDSWLASGEVWQIPAMDDVREVRIGGKVNTYWGENGQLVVEHNDYTPVLATPYDLPISGYETDNVSTLRLWEARSPIPLDMKLFSQGEYLKAVEKHAMAEVISMVLYPEDNHREGQSLRLKQQYFLVSATIQDICAKHKAKYGSLLNFARKHVLHINDTHPTLVIPELMRILMDEEGMGWDKAWNIVSQSVAYTNHTVMPEALECWPIDLVESLMPRVMMIINEINERFCRELWNYYPGDFQRISKMAIVSDGVVRMANLALAGSFSVNGVSELHSDILREKVFRDFYHVMPIKFRNVTNGIAHRRWLCEANPELAQFITRRIGKGFITHPSELQVLSNYGTDKKALEELAAIKHANKARLAAYIKEHNGIEVNLDSIFDVQVKRLHEYKRQMLNILHILYLYRKLKENPSMDFVPRTFIFGSKAAPGYTVAKKTICLINSMANRINNDPDIGDKLKVVFIEDYKVSLAEIIMPAAELSEQISMAGKEASGTGNMKFMMNGALTVGTMDGANVEICQAVGEENIFIFGMNTQEAEELSSSGKYAPLQIYQNNDAVRGVLDMMKEGFGDGQKYGDMVDMLLKGSNGVADRYLTLADFDSYVKAQERVSQMYLRPENWNYMSLMNIANSGRFAADRSIAEYAKNIWKVHTDFAY